MAAPIVETVWLVNGFKSHIVMAAPFEETAPSSVQNLINSSSRRFDGKSMSLDDRDYQKKGIRVARIRNTYIAVYLGRKWSKGEIRKPKGEQYQH